MQEIKSKYQMKMEKLRKAGIAQLLSPEENMRVAKEFTAGFDEFRAAQSKRSRAAQKALAKVCLNM